MKLPNTELASEMFDYLPKKDGNWEEMVSTAAYLLAMIYAAGSENKQKSMSMLVAFPDSDIVNKRDKEYKVTIEQGGD